MEEIKKTYEEELAEVREDFVKVKAEKEHFRVRNELLHNMSKIIVDKCLKGNKSNNTNPDDTEKIDDNEDVDDATIFLNKMKENKNRGYRRVNPMEAPTKEKEKRIEAKTAKSSKKAHGKSNSDDENIEPMDNFCHFFNNYKKCLFEENTGKKCKFAHRKAPLCDFDGQCGRSKCMFRHTRQTTNKVNFLGQRNTNFLPQMERDWNPNPWANQFQGRQMPNPWIWQGKRNAQ